jgi:hypothetical protein
MTHYETPIFIYSKEMDQLIEAITISNKVEEGDYETCPYGKMMESNDEEENIVHKTPCLKDVVMDEEEEGTESTTPRT